MDDNEVTRSTLTDIFTLGDNEESSGDVTLRDLIRGFLDSNFLEGLEDTGRITHDNLTLSTVGLTSVRNTFNERSESAASDVLVEFTTTSITNIASNLHLGLNIGNSNNNGLNSD